MNKDFRQLHSANFSVSELRKVAEEARMRPTLVFVDEIHRLSATQQDSLLESCESGLFDLLAATTGNPFHVLTPALVSRSTILKLEPLEIGQIETILVRAIEHLSKAAIRVAIDPAEIKAIAARAGGDGRRALNTLEGLVAGANPGETVTVTKEMVDDVLQASPIPYDRTGDAHYDVISAFVKSMRGSDPDATLYWLARLVHGGEDPRYIARRIMIHASEDIGLADNTALQTAVAASQAAEKIGYPEAQIVLAHAALHVARAPKSASASRGIAAALAYVQSQPLVQVPAHLRDSHYKGASALGVGGYQFPHDSPIGWVAQDYAPGVPRGSLYQSDARGNPTFEERADKFWGDAQGRTQPVTFSKRR